MTAEYINLLEEYSEFLPDEIVSLNDVSAVLGAVSIVKESVDTGVPVETILSTNNDIQKEAVGDDSTELCIVELETVTENGEQHLEFTGVRSRPVLETDIVEYPFYQKNQGASKSLTQRSNDKEPDKFFKLTKNGVFYPLFSGWCELSEDMDSRPWWIDALQEIGETAELEYPDYPTVKQPTIYQQIEQTVQNELFTDSESFDGFVSIEIDGQPPSELSGYQSVMNHIVKKNLCFHKNTQSVGEGVGLVSNTVGEVTGVSDTMWADYNSSEQLEEQPYMSKEDAWRYRPIRVTTAQFMDRGTNIIEDLFAYLSFGDNQYSLNYYVIPSLYGSYSFEDAVNWYDMVEMIGDEHRASSTVLKASIGLIDDDVDEVDLLGGENSGFTADVVFVSLQEDEGNKQKELLHNVVFTDRIEQVTETITDVADSIVSRYPLRNPESEYDDIFTAGVRGDMLAGTVFNPQWFAENLCGTEYSVPSSNSIEHQVSQSLLFNEEISVPELLQSFVERLVYIETDIESLVNKGNGYYSFVRTIGRQQLVLQSVEELGLYNAPVSETENFNTSRYLDIHMSDSECNIQGEGLIPFYLGRIVGGLSYTQQSKYGVSSPAFSQYSIDYVSQQNFQKVYQEVVTKVLQYTNKSGNNSQLEEYMEMKELADALQKNPSDWDITEAEFKYYYALGVTDGFTYTEQDGEQEE